MVVFLPQNLQGLTDHRIATIMIICIFIFSCSSIEDQTTGDVIESPPSIEYDRDLPLEESCKEFIKSKRDSSRHLLLKTSTYYSDGKIASEYHHLESTYTREGTTRLYDYKNGELVQRRTVDTNLDSTKTIYIYDEKGLLIREDHYDYKKRIRDEVDKGLGRPGGCIVYEEDYEVERSWEKRSVIHFKYDTKGRKIEYHAPTIHWSDQNKYTWIYDDNGEIIEHNSYDHDRLIWTEKFAYSESKYEMTRTWYDHNGDPKHLKEKWEYTPKLTFTFILNDDNREVEKIVRTEKGELRSRKITMYDKEGRIIKTETYDSNNKYLNTHYLEFENIYSDKEII